MTAQIAAALVEPYVMWNLHSLSVTPDQLGRLLEAGLIYQPDERDPALHYPESGDVDDDGTARFEAIAAWVHGREPFEAIPPVKADN